MDVTCERCGTEYEFDETLVSDRGTTVKCTNCGHLFKVFRPDKESSAARAWNIRTADGGTRKLSSLKELQRLITAGTLTEDDRIARGDEEFKRLGDIAELSTFFAAATTAPGEPDGPGKRDRKQTSPGMAAAPAPPGPSPQPPPRTPPPPRPEGPRAPPPRRNKSTMLGMGASPAPASAPPPRPPAPDPEDSPTIPEAPRVPAEAAPATPAVPPRRAVPAPPSRPTPSDRPAASRPQSERPLYIDDDEPVVPQRGRSRSGLWVGLVLVVAVAVGVARGWPQIAPLIGLADEEVEENPAAEHLEPGDEALAGDTVDDYETALHHYTQALAFDDHDVATLTRLSRAHALWAQALAFDASDLEAMADEDPARRGEANAIRREQERHADTALSRAEDAVRYGSGDASAEVALSDALRLTGDLERARSRLNRALTLRSEADAETLRVQALVEAASNGGDLSHARDFAEQAVAEDPTMIRARLLYARALLAASETSGARSQVDAILRRDESHERAMALRDAIDEGRPPAPATSGEAEGDAGIEEASPEDEDEAVDEEEPSGSGDGPASAGGGRRGSRGDDSGGTPSGRDYSFYVRRADELRGRSQYGPAREHYEAALSQRPSGSEALNGMGNVLLQTGDPSGAAARFRQAASQGYGEAYIGLGRAYRRLGRNADALASFERYLQRMPSGPHAAVARRQIEELRRLGGGGGGGGGSGGGGGGGAGGGSGGGSDSPPPGDQLPPPRDVQNPPPPDVPAIDSEP